MSSDYHSLKSTCQHLLKILGSNSSKNNKTTQNKYSHKAEEIIESLLDIQFSNRDLYLKNFQLTKKLENEIHLYEDEYKNIEKLNIQKKRLLCEMNFYKKTMNPDEIINELPLKKKSKSVFNSSSESTENSRITLLHQLNTLEKLNTKRKNLKTLRNNIHKENKELTKFYENVNSKLIEFNQFAKEFSKILKLPKFIAPIDYKVKILPSPLYTLYHHVFIFNQTCDKSIEMEIEGNLINKCKNNKKIKLTDLVDKIAADEEKEDGELNLIHRPSLNKSPINLILKFKINHNTIPMTFTYNEMNGIIYVDMKNTKNSKKILDSLFTMVEDIPKTHLNKKNHLGIYSWAQAICGLNVSCKYINQVKVEELYTSLENIIEIRETLERQYKSFFNKRFMLKSDVNKQKISLINNVSEFNKFQKIELNEFNTAAKEHNLSEEQSTKSEYFRLSFIYESVFLFIYICVFPDYPKHKSKFVIKLIKQNKIIINKNLLNKLSLKREQFELSHNFNFDHNLSSELANGIFYDKIEDQNMELTYQLIYIQNFFDNWIVMNNIYNNKMNENKDIKYYGRERKLIFKIYLK